MSDVNSVSDSEESDTALFAHLEKKEPNLSSPTRDITPKLPRRSNMSSFIIPKLNFKQVDRSKTIRMKTKAITSLQPPTKSLENRKLSDLNKIRGGSSIKHPKRVSSTKQINLLPMTSQSQADRKTARTQNPPFSTTKSDDKTPQNHKERPSLEELNLSITEVEHEIIRKRNLVKLMWEAVRDYEVENSQLNRELLIISYSKLMEMQKPDDLLTEEPILKSNLVKMMSDTSESTAMDVAEEFLDYAMVMR